ncbi:hypothetical protein [Arthrobacter sp. NPDC056493]|uniref:hypothetical protein n=1 Tax=Arthrobacter sp. NPDC056493 TaxID=3345839 RepID=UPI0036729540
MSKEPLAPYTPRTVQATGAAGIPAEGVSAVLVTMTAVAPTAAGQMSAGPADGAMTGVMRYDASPYTSNSAIVMMSDVGQIQIQATTTANVMVDVQGYYTAGNGVTAAGGYSPVKQTRTVDTVNGVGLPKAKLTGGSTSTIQVTGTASVPAGAKAAFVNFQVNNANTTAGYFNPYATSATSRPGTSLNFDGSPFTSIGAIVPLAADGTIKVYLSTGNTIDLLMDVEGYFTPGGSSSDAGVFTPAVAKIYDTRATGHVAPGATVTIPVGGTNDIPSADNGLSAIVANLIVIDSGTAGGYARAYASGTTEPTNVATLTFNKGTAGALTTNLATIPVGSDNAIKIHNVSTDTVDYILDLNGWYTKMPTVAFSCPTPFVGASWTEGTTPTMVDCTLAATNPYGSPLSVSVAYDGTSYGLYSVPARSSISPAIAVPAHTGEHVISAETTTPIGEQVMTTYEFAVGNWSTSRWGTSLANGSTTDFPPTLDYAPYYGSFPDDGTLVFALTTNPDGQSNPIQTSNGTTRDMPVADGLLAPGTTYYWTATATGRVEGRQDLITRTSNVYSFTTSAKYTSEDQPAPSTNCEDTASDLASQESIQDAVAEDADRSIGFTCVADLVTVAVADDSGDSVAEVVQEGPTEEPIDLTGLDAQDRAALLPQVELTNTEIVAESPTTQAGEMQPLSTTINSQYRASSNDTLWWGQMTTAKVVIWKSSIKLNTWISLQKTRHSFNVFYTSMNKRQISVTIPLRMRESIPLWWDRDVDTLVFRPFSFGTSFTQTQFPETDGPGKFFAEMYNMSINDRSAGRVFKVAGTIKLPRFQCYITAPCKYPYGREA